MSGKLTLPNCLIFLSVMLVSMVLTFAQNHQVRKEFRPFTQNLPLVDKIELLKYKIYGKPEDTKIEATKILNRVKAKNLASLWRNQVFGLYTSACHNPKYGIKFFSQTRLIAYASVCWDCDTIALEKPFINETQYFDGKTRKGQKLFHIFQSLFSEN